MGNRHPRNSRMAVRTIHQLLLHGVNRYTGKKGCEGEGSNGSHPDMVASLYSPVSRQTRAQHRHPEPGVALAEEELSDTNLR